MTTAVGNPRIVLASDRSILVTFGDRIDPQFHRRVRALFEAMQHARFKGVLNLHPAYASLLIDFDPSIFPPDDLIGQLSAMLELTQQSATVSRHACDDTATAGRAALETPESRRIEIPVCYGGKFGRDLDDVAAMCRLTAGEVIQRHSLPEYLVHFIGFAPGFPYLGRLDPGLAVPRLETPRKLVPAGSVAIGGEQTGIYPSESPGGWRIIGRTPLRLFDPGRERPALLSIGDRIRFRPIPADEFERTASGVN